MKGLLIWVDWSELRTDAVVPETGRIGGVGSAGGAAAPRSESESVQGRFAGLYRGGKLSLQEESSLRWGAKAGGGKG